MNSRGTALVAILAVGNLTTPSLAGAQKAQEPGALAIVQDRIYRTGVFLIVDALVENKSPRKVEGAEALVEFYNFFDELVRVEPSALSPATLGPGQVAALRGVTPYSETVRKIRYRFTWREDGEQLQEVEKRDIWTIGSPTRAPGRHGW